MKQTNRRHILIRYSFVVGFMLIISILIILETFKTTVINGKLWREKADSIWMDTTQIEPERGRILADNGTVLAANMYFYTARVDWGGDGIKDDTLKKYLPALCDSLHAFEPGMKTSERWMKDLLRARATRNRSYRLFTKLSHAEVERLRSFPIFKKKKNESGFYTEKIMVRCKPYGMMAARSIGNTVGDTTGYRDKSGKVRYNKAIHGNSGLEMALDSLLYGVPGIAKRIQLTNNAVNWESTPAVPGYDITTTINVQLQDIVENELAAMLAESNAQWGTAVLMETATGEIKAISNLERTRDGSDYIEGSNHAVSGYEPGSVMKPISMMVALEDGIVKNIDEQWVTGSVWFYAGRAIKDEHGAARSLSPRQIIERSSNLGMSKIIAKKYGNNPDGFRKRLAGMGFFEPYHTGIAGETRPYFAMLKNDNAGRVSLTRMAFGYATRIPPMYILGMYNAIANNGIFMRPHLVKRLTLPMRQDSIVPVDYKSRRVCSADNAQKLRIMLHDVVWGDRGTARKWVQSGVVEIAGKTGTAYDIDKSGHYDNGTKRLAFCGFFPYDHPQYTCVVLILGANRGAGASSGMVLKNIALKMYARGLLNNVSDYTQGNTQANKTPFLHATANPERKERLKTGVGISQARVFALSAPLGRGKMPNVLGMSAREAVAKLERLGMTVRCSGQGYVCSQSVAAGSPYQHGEMVYLKLRYR